MIISHVNGCLPNILHDKVVLTLWSADSGVWALLDATFFSVAALLN